MRIHFDISALRAAKWYEYALRFLFGGAITVITGVLARRCGPVFGGLFLAFPAIFPASATLVEKHDAVDSDLASAQTPPFSSQRPGQHRFERGDFLRRSLSFAPSRFSTVFDAAPCFGGTFYIDNSVLFT